MIDAMERGPGRPRAGDEFGRFCTACGEYLPWARFARSGKYRDGQQRHSGVCKVCAAERVRQWRSEHPDYHKDYYRQRANGTVNDSQQVEEE